MKIVCDEIINVDVNYDKKLEIELSNVDFRFILNVDVDDLIAECDNERVFEAIIEKDEEILHNYLTKSGYTFNKN